MTRLEIEQAIYGGQDSGSYRFLARSPGFLEEWLPEVQRLCTAFGERPPEVACPSCVFAQPLGKALVVVVQVADLGRDATGQPMALGFHLLVLLHSAYTNLGGDPFLLAERFPPSWHVRGELPVLAWPAEPVPSRTVEQVQKALQRADGPSLLGGAQALVDGGRLVFERPGPDTELMRGLWTLLPASTRCHLWPASFAFSNMLGFDAVVVRRATGDEFAGYLSEEQAGHYPEGHYELHLQIAAEAGDQQELNALFGRRSRQEAWRLGVILLALIVVLVTFGNWLGPAPSGKAPAPPVAKLELPPSSQFRSLSKAERQQLTQALQRLAGALGVQPLPKPATAERLLIAISSQVETSDVARDPGRNLTSGPVQRRLRALLWKYDIAEYRDPNLNSLELVERLRKRLTAPNAEESPRRD